MSSSLISLVTVIGLWLCLTLLCCAHGNSGLTPDGPKASATPYRVTAGELLRDYENNEVSADGTYRDRRLAVTGVVETIGKDILDTPYVTLTADGKMMLPSVQCMFDDNPDLAALARLGKGMKITVEGTCQGKTMNVLLRGCVVR